MALFWWAIGALVLVFLFFLVQYVYLAMVLKWEDDETVGLKYYGRPVAERAAFKDTLRRHAKRLGLVLKINARSGKLDFRKARIVYNGLSGPSGSCSVESFERGHKYPARAEDVFVATQMKCGTTWMQHVVYQVLHRGEGNLVETGTALYAVSPWLEGRKSVPLEDAPLLGKERPSRLIKTHFPANFCPVNEQARYVYVARHPVSCLASSIDFVVTNVGGYAPELPAFEEWFMSPELMWWGTWTDHVRGWWERAQRDSNVLFVYFEEMKRDLPAVIRRVASFLGVAPLNETEVAEVAHKCSFKYMQEHNEAFEMHPPHILQTSAELFVSGSADRHKDVPEETRERILRWAASGLGESMAAVSAEYQDLVREVKATT